MTTSQQLADRAGISYRQLDHWARIGYLKPQGSTASGRERNWSPAEQDVAVAMGQLCQYGIPPKLARDLARAHLAGDVLDVLWKLPEQPEGVRPRASAH
jgi:DNA-binding transcriptional MerR regulator